AALGDVDHQAHLFGSAAVAVESEPGRRAAGGAQRRAGALATQRPCSTAERAPELFQAIEPRRHAPSPRPSAFAALDAIRADLLVQVCAFDPECDARLGDVPIEGAQRFEDVLPLGGL